MLTYRQRSIATFTLSLLLAACKAPQPNVEETPTRTASATAEAQATQVLPPATLTTAPSTSTATPSPTALPATAIPKPIATKRPSSTPDSSTALIISFTVTPTVVTAGDSVTLSWEAIGERAVICSIPNFHETGCFEVPLVGSRNIIIDQDGIPYQFNLRAETAYNVDYHSVVVCTGTTDWFFDYQANWCATAPPLNSQAAAQRFEHGWMIWIEARGEFLIFIDNAYYRSFSSIQLKPDASENHRIGNVPAGLYEPVSGFGLLWRGEIVGVESIREELGWALQPEFGFETTYECAMPVSNYTISDCYLRGPQRIWHFHSHYIAGFFWEELASP